VTRLLSDIVAITPSNFDDFTRCPRLFLNKALLGVPESDPAPSTDQGLLVHDMLYRIHKGGSCQDDAHVLDVLAAHGADSQAVRALIARHAQRCPSAVDGAAHEHALARFHRMPKPGGRERIDKW
jgi:hypothetical protein